MPYLLLIAVQRLLPEATRTLPTNCCPLGSGVPLLRWPEFYHNSVQRDANDATAKPADSKISPLPRNRQRARRCGVPTTDSRGALPQG